jgi:RimJ/RimL family protein N-acetyltransferase
VNEILRTNRLSLRKFQKKEDARFILELTNSADFLKNIGDHKIRTLEDAEGYIENRLSASYEKYGFGFWVSEIRESGIPAGMCGLIKRDGFEYPEIGFAYLPEFYGIGFATEVALAVKQYAGKEFGLEFIMAIANPGNDASIRVLSKLGLIETGRTRLPGELEDVLVFGPVATLPFIQAQ